ncbi:hypothetical protein JCM3774_000104 [Rhodotorula dairenensis]
MSAGVVFVELADAEAVGQACSSRFATSGVVIKAGQPYETALAEVRRHFGVEDDACYASSFAQRFPGREKRFIVAASAWEMVAAGTNLEFIIAKVSVVKVPPSSPYGPVEHLAPLPAGQSVRALSSPVRRNSRQYSPPAQPPSGIHSHSHSQNSGACIAPATPSGTDTDGQVTDSEAEEDFADQMEKQNSARRSVQASLSPVSTPHRRLPVEVAAGSERDRSATPSPSNRSTDYKVYLHQRLEAERQLEAEEEEARESTGEPQSSAVPVPYAAPSPAGNSDLAVRQAGRAARETPRTEPQTRLGASSGETEISLMIGLDANGNVNFVPRSPSPALNAINRPASRTSTTPRNFRDKGKGRAILVEETASEAEDSAGSVKREFMSSQPVRALVRQAAVPTPPKPLLAIRTPFRALQGQNDGTVFSPTPAQKSSAAPFPPPSPSTKSRKRPAPSTSEEEGTFTPSKQHCVTASRLLAEGWNPPAPTSSRHHRVTSASPRKTDSAARKQWEERRREALSKPRASIPPPGRSERFHYWLRLPNWPPAPRNQGPLKAQYVFKQHARGNNITLGLRLEHVFQTASELTGWKMQDLRATFYTHDDEGKVTQTYVWGWDHMLIGFRDLEEMGMPDAGGLIDFDYIPYSPTRSYLDWE